MSESPQEPRQPNEALKRARKERGWTQDEAATAVGCSIDAIQRWERGERSRLWKKWRDRLCEVYQSTPEELGLRPRVSKETGLRALQESAALVPARSLDQPDSLE